MPSTKAPETVPAFLKPPEETKTKQKPGPKPGVLKVTSPCPYCGEPAHRKAVQHVKGVGPLRRMYCAGGCGHYHYRDVKTNDVVEAGKGPRFDIHIESRDEISRLRDELKTTKQALKRAERDLKNAPKATKQEADRDWLFDLADSLGIDPGKLGFTSFPEGKPRAIVYGLSDAEIASLDRDVAETVAKLHLTLLTVQECIRAYKARLPKGKK